MTLAQVRQEHGSIKQAVNYYGGELRLSKRATAKELGICLDTLYRWLDRFQLHDIFPKERKDMHPQCRVGGRPGIQRFDRRKPIEKDGFLWYPGEPTHHYLWRQK